jgi:hypothetical protein
MEETDEKSAGGAEGAAREGDSEAAAELRAEEESAKAMEAEVPHPPGYPNPGQEQPS